jgi:hypothetical protein
MALSAYNYFYSVGNKFNILTYGRFTYVEGPFNNSTVRTQNKINIKSKIKLNDKEHVFVREKLKRELPQTSDIWIRSFSWDLSKYSKAIINTRYGIFPQIKNDTLFYCCRGNMNDVKCFPLKREANLSNDSLQKLIANFSENKTTLKIKSFLAFFTNISLNYDQAYYGMVPNSYKCTIEKSNGFTVNLAQTEKGQKLIDYVLGKDAIKKEVLGFGRRYKRLTEDPIFKGYDLYNEFISKRLFRNNIWVYTFFISFVLICFKCWKCRLNDALQVTLLYFGLVLIGSSFIFTFFGNSLPRYSFATEFVLYFNVIFLISEQIPSLLTWLNKKPNLASKS